MTRRVTFEFRHDLDREAEDLLVAALWDLTARGGYDQSATAVPEDDTP